MEGERGMVEDSGEEDEGGEGGGVMEVKGWGCVGAYRCLMWAA